MKIFSGEVVRFGNRCKDPQWHNLDRYFTRLETDLTPQRQLKEEALGVMEQMLVLVHCTADLYHEFHSLDRFEQDYKRKIREEENTNVTQRGENLQILKHELKTQRKHVANLKKKSLWSKSLEEVIEKLVDIVHFIHLEIHDAFGNTGGALTIKTPISHQRLGTAGLALHYANIITQIDTLVSRSGSVPSNTRDSLYQGLPPRIKSHLRSKLQSFHVKEELTVPQIKAEMEKTLQWLVPIANNTTKVHHGFGWVGEWANTGTQLNRNPSGSEIIRLETLYHADKDKTEAYILDLVVWLHHLISRSRPTNGAMQSPKKSPIRSPSHNNHSKDASADNKSNGQTSSLSQEDQNMLRNVRNWKHMTPGISKSQEFRTGNARLYEDIKLSKSSSHSPMTNHAVKEIPSISRRSSAIIDFDIDRIKALDAIDRIDTLRNL